MTVSYPYILLRISFLMTACMIAGCQYQIVSSMGYGKIPSQGNDPYDQGFTVVMPPTAPSISQRFQPDQTAGKIHFGLDIIGTKKTPIIAAADGTVIISRKSIWGNHIVIDHGITESGSQLHSEYAHLSERHVQQGDTVVRGQEIGKMGRSGLLSGGLVHLHFSVTESPPGDIPGPDDDVNPHRHWVDGPGKVSCYSPSMNIAKYPQRLTYPVPCLEQ